MAMFRSRGYNIDGYAGRFDFKMLQLLWRFVRPFCGLLSIILGLMLIGTAAELFRPYLLKVAIDEKIALADSNGLFKVAAVYLGTIIISILFSYGQLVLLQYIGQKVIYNMRQKIFQRIIAREYRDLTEIPVGTLVTRVTNDTDAIRDLYSEVLVALVGDGLVLIGIVAVMLLMNWRLALMALVALPLMAGLTITYQKYARIAYRNVRAKTAAVNSHLQEMMNGISIIKAFGRFKRSEEEFRTVNYDFYRAGMREMYTFAIFRPLVDLIYWVIVALILWYSGWGSQLAGGVAIGVIVAFLSYVEKFFWPIRDLAEKYNLLQSALAATERVYQLLTDEPVSPVVKQDCGPLIGDIEFHDVWFAYEEPEWVLRGVSFVIRAGAFTGLAGPSGSGKTTIIGLLLRFYEPQRGYITIGGRNIKDIPGEKLRREIGVVFQDVHLFKGTIGENIRLYNPDIPATDMLAAAKTANVDQFVDKLSPGYDSMVGYEGALLSLGQRQLISLARALTTKAGVLVLDEATSSIDGKTETLIQNALAKITGERTMLVIAHRLSTIKQADRIIMLDHGIIVEQGTHDELMGRKGLYYYLVNGQ